MPRIFVLSLLSNLQVLASFCNLDLYTDAVDVLLGTRVGCTQKQAQLTSVLQELLERDWIISSELFFGMHAFRTVWNLHNISWRIVWGADCKMKSQNAMEYFLELHCWTKQHHVCHGQVTNVMTVKAPSFLRVDGQNLLLCLSPRCPLGFVAWRQHACWLPHYPGMAQSMFWSEEAFDPSAAQAWFLEAGHWPPGPLMDCLWFKCVCVCVLFCLDTLTWWHGTAWQNQIFPIFFQPKDQFIRWMNDFRVSLWRPEGWHSMPTLLILARGHRGCTHGNVHTEYHLGFPKCSTTFKDSI